MCGSCTACLEACPTGALPAPYVARRDALHQLPDHRGEGRHPGGSARGPGPARLRLRHLPGRLPLEPQAARARRRRLSSRGPGSVAPDLDDSPRLDEEAFRERFRQSPVKRAKRRGLLRNVAVALGNAGDPRSGRSSSGSRKTRIRSSASTREWALGRLDASRQRRSLRLSVQLVVRPGGQFHLFAAGREHGGAAGRAADQAALGRAAPPSAIAPMRAPAAAAPPAIFVSRPGSTPRSRRTRSLDP